MKDNDIIIKSKNRNMNFFLQNKIEEQKVGDTTLTLEQKIQFSQFFFTPLLKVKKKQVKYCEEFYNYLLKISQVQDQGDQFYQQILNCMTLIQSVSIPFRTELLMQLYKYNTHIQPQEQIKSFQILACISNFVQINFDFLPYYLNFLIGLIENDKVNDISKTYIKYAIVNFIKNNEIGDRTIAPVYSQVRAILQLTKDYLRIYLSPDKFIELYVDLFETCKEIKIKVMKFLEIPEDLEAFFCFFEEIHHDDYLESSIIGDFVRVCDVLVSWESNLNFNKKNDYTNSEDDYLNNALRYNPQRKKIFLKVQYFNNNLGDEVTDIFNTFQILNFTRNYANNNYNMTKKKQKQFIAVYVKLKNIPLTSNNLDVLHHQIKKSINFLGNGSNVQVVLDEDILLEEIKLLKETTPQELKQKMLEIVQENLMSNSNLFRVTIPSGKFFVRKNLVICPDKCCILHDDFEIKFILDYSKLKEMIIKQDELIFSYMGQMNAHTLQHLIQTRKKLGESITQNQQEFDENEKQIQNLSITSPQIKLIYHQIINYINLKMYNNKECLTPYVPDKQRLYQDIDKLPFEKDQIEKVLNNDQDYYSINRFKKRLFNIQIIYLNKILIIYQQNFYITIQLNFFKVFYFFPLQTFQSILSLIKKEIIYIIYFLNISLMEWFQKYLI